MEHASKKVLIVEDDALLLITLTNQFDEAGYTVLTAKDGNDALSIFHKEHPHAVVLDIMMPGMDGIALLEAVRADGSGADTPFIILTNANDADYRERAEHAGATAYLLKSDRHIDSIVRLVEERLAAH